jgi:alpha-tubulin suppressor-like RCC1 family protein
VAFVSLAAGEFSTCALGTTGAAYCWGDVAPEMPSNGGVARNSPALVDGNNAFISLANGYYHACALTASGAAYCWGSGFSGQLGDGSVIDYRASPSVVTGGLRFASVSGGYWHTCGVSVQGAGYCWGNNNWAQLGDSTRAAHGAPAPVSGAVVFTRLAAGGRHTCGLSMAGDAWCWGWNAFGQVGDGTTAMRLTPTPVVSSSRLVFSNIFAGWYHTCGLTATGAAYCWGFNAHGQLGDGTTTDRAARRRSPRVVVRRPRLAWITRAASRQPVPRIAGGSMGTASWETGRQPMRTTRCWSVEFLAAESDGVVRGRLAHTITSADVAYANPCASGK